VWGGVFVVSFLEAEVLRRKYEPEKLNCGSFVAGKEA
jgi:hypothetical protein